MKLIKKILTLTVIVFTFTSCFIFFDDSIPRGIINLQNCTDLAVYVYATDKNTLPLNPKLNLFDTIATTNSSQKKDSIISPLYRLNPYMFYVDFKKNEGGINFDNYSSKSVDKKIRLYFIKESIMRTKTWSEIYKGQLYEKKMIFTEDELTKLNWNVKYE